MASQRIWKYVLPVTDYPSILMPEHSQVLSVQNQNGEITLWAVVDPDKPMTIRKFHIVGTGNKTNIDGEKFLGTVQCFPFVWHIFEKPIM